MSAVLIGALLAFVNGANDLSKGIATLVGSGVATPRRAIAWGALWTLLGGLSGAIFATAMVTTFGKGLLASAVAPSHAAAVASIAGAAAWVLVATIAGLPVSTTHAIVGAVVGVAAVAYGPDSVRWSALGAKVVVPLLASPLVAVALAAAGRRAMGERAAPSDCVCVDVEPIALPALAGAAAAGASHTAVTRGTAQACAADRPAALHITVDRVHWSTSGAICFARAMNDAPKIAALVAVAEAAGATSALRMAPAFVLITLAMVAGGVLAGRRVTRVMGERLARIAPRDGFAANAVTALLVTGGATLGLPMSTTHVASGGIAGTALGQGRGALDARTARDIALAWLVTVPASAVLGIGAYALAARLP